VREIFADGIRLDFRGRIAVEIKDNPTTLMVRVEDRQLQLLAIMEQSVLRPHINFFVEAKTIRGYVVSELPARGSRTVDLGGLTIPWTSFCQLDSSGVYFSSSRWTLLSFEVIFIIVFYFIL